MKSARAIVSAVPRANASLRAGLAALQLAALVWFAPRTVGFPLDDAWIHQVVARTFVESGTLGFAPGEHGAAATSYLWAVVCALNLAVVHLHPATWTALVSGAATIAAGQLLYDMLARTRPEGFGETTWRVVSALAAALSCAGAHALWFAWSGMEASLLVALTILAMWAATRDVAPAGDGAAHDATRRTLGVTGAAAALLALLRPEAMPLGAMLAAWTFWRTRRAKDAAIVAAPWLAAVAIYLGSNLALSGHAMPATLSGRRWLWFDASAGLSRVELVVEMAEFWAQRLSFYCVASLAALIWVTTGLAVYGAVRLVRLANPGMRLLLGWTALHALFYAVMLPTPGHGGRYQPLLPILFVACGAIGSALVLVDLARLVVPRHATTAAPWLTLPLAGWAALGWLGADRLRDANEIAVLHIEGTEIAMGEWLATLPRERVIASFDIGGIAWASRRRILDAGGLSDPNVAKLLEQGTLAQHLAAKRVDTIVLPEARDAQWIDPSTFHYRLGLSTDPAITLAPIHVFESPDERWGAGVEATWNAAPKQVAYRLAFLGAPTARAHGSVPFAARRAMHDDAALVRPRDRARAEHALAVLAEWGVGVDVATTLARPAPASACRVAFGRWGVDVSGCDAVAPSLSYAMHEHLGRYLDHDDFGGAAREIPFVVERARRAVDPTFRPQLPPNLYPIDGGWSTQGSRTASWGVPLVFLVFAAASALWQLADHRTRLAARLSDLFARVVRGSAREAA